MNTIQMRSKALLTSILGGALALACGADGLHEEDLTWVDGETELQGDDDGVETEGSDELNRYSGNAPALRDSLEPGGEVTLARADGSFRTYEYDVYDGQAVAEGDILLGSIEDLELTDKGLIKTGLQWPERTVVYQLGTLNRTQRSNVVEAMRLWTEATGIEFLRRDRNERDYVRFTTKAGVCNSPVGRVGGQQLINLDATGCGLAAILHEIGHALGLEHEHTRSDRDNVIDYHSDRVITAMDFAFTINDSRAHQNVGRLDFNSIMMYDSFAFASTDGTNACNSGDRGCKPTLTLAGTENTWRAPTSLSAGDVRAVLTLYPEYESPTVESNLAKFTPIRRFASGENGDQFCIDQGFRRMLSHDFTSRSGSVVASYDDASRRWVASRPSVTVGVYTQITCAF